MRTIGVDDEKLFIGIGVDGREGVHVVGMHGIGSIVIGGDNAVFDDEADDEAKIGGGGVAIGQRHFRSAR